MCMNHKPRPQQGDRINHVVGAAVCGIAGLYSLDFLLSNVGFALMLFSVYCFVVLGMASASVWALVAQFVTKS